MVKGEGACLVCGKPLIYHEHAVDMQCMMCHKKLQSHACCEDGHFICDDCHAEKGISSVLDYCRANKSKNPILIIQGMMDDPFVHMHGPEHHIMVGAALITAYHNAGGEAGLEAALAEMKARGSQYPGGSCGFWGCCGAAVSAGMFMSIITGATPLTTKPWRLSNKMTAKALDSIGELGGPRCCKRNSFTAIKEAVGFVRDNLNVKMELPERIECHYSSENRQCRRIACPYYFEASR